MNAIEKFLQLMPGFNKAIAEQFPQQIELWLNWKEGVSDAAKFFFTTKTSFLNKPLVGDISWPGIAYIKFRSFFFEDASYNKVFSVPGLYEFDMGYGLAAVPANITFVADGRLFASVSEITARYSKGGYLSSTIEFSVSLFLKDYTIEKLSVIADYGIKADFIDYAKLSQFLVYLHAYEKYKTQITAELAAMQARARKDAQDFSQKVKIATNQQYVTLSAHASQMLQSIQAEARAQKVALESAKNSLNSYALQLRGLCG